MENPSINEKKMICVWDNARTRRSVDMLIRQCDIEEGVLSHKPEKSTLQLCERL
jgi:hypothetical protein